MIVDEDIYLEHFGVKGMKWGIRNNKGNAESNQKITKLDKNSDISRDISFSKKYHKAKKYDRRRVRISRVAGGAAFIVSRRQKMKRSAKVGVTGGTYLITNALLKKHYDKKLSYM